MFIRKRAIALFILTAALGCAMPAEANWLYGSSNSSRADAGRIPKNVSTGGNLVAVLSEIIPVAAMTTGTGGAFIIGAPLLGEAFTRECTGYAINLGARGRESGDCVGGPKPEAEQLVPGLLIEAFCQTPTGRFRVDIQYHVGSVCHSLRHGRTEYGLVAP